MHDAKNAAGTPVGFGNGLTINIGKDFVLANSFTAEANQDAEHKDGVGVFQGISGNSVFVGEYDNMNKTKVVIAAEIYDSIKDSTRFREVTVDKATAGNQGNQGNTGNQGNDNAGTGDMTWVVAVVASIAVMGCAVVVAKKRA